MIEFRALDATHVITQARAVLEDMPVAAFKIGMLGSVENVEAIHSILQDYPHIPLILDPVMAPATAPAWVTSNCWKPSRSCYCRAPP